MKRDQVKVWVMRLFDQYAVGGPVYLELLNSTLIICLSAYVIARSEENGREESRALTYSYWMKEIERGRRVHVEDLFYDVIVPQTPKEVRGAVSGLGNATVPLIEPLVKVFYNLKPDVDIVREITECIITTYYPSVIMGPVSTPSTVNRMCVRLLAPEKGTFYDGAAGIGSTCVEAGRYAEENGGSLSIWAQEKLAMLCPVLTIRAYINGLEQITVHRGDTLLFPQYMENGYSVHFDYSIMFPPLGQSWESASCEVEMARNDLWGVPKSNAEWLFVQHMIASLRCETGRGIVAVSTGTLFNEAACYVRHRVLEQNCIECVIGLPGNILPNSPAPLSLLLINKGLSRQKSAGILMVQAERLFPTASKIRLAEQLDEKIMSQIESIVKTRASTFCSRVVPLEEIRQNDWVLLPSRYMTDRRVDSALGPLVINLHRTQEWPRLNAAAEKIYRGINSKWVSKEGAGRQYKLINYADIQDGVLQTENLKTCLVQKNVEGCLVRTGDILVSCKGAQIKTCIVPETAEGALLSLNFIGLRLKKQLYCPEFLLHYLNSPVGLSYLRGRQVGTSIVTLKNEDLRQMPIPPVPFELQAEYTKEYAKACREIEEAVRRLRLEREQETWKLYHRMGLKSVLSKAQE